MRQVLPDTSLPLLGSRDATLTSQHLILHLFLPVSLTPCLPHLSGLVLSPVPHSFTRTPHQIHEPEADSRLELKTQVLCTHPTSPSSSRTSTLTLAGVSGYGYQYKLDDKRLHRKKKNIYLVSALSGGKKNSTWYKRIMLSLGFPLICCDSLSGCFGVV